jgi:HSP20 family protein
MQVSVYEPSNGLSLREAVGRLLEDGFARSTSHERNSQVIPVDIVETPEALLVSAQIPGAAKDKLEISYEKDILSIKAELPVTAVPENGRMLLRERGHGSLSRTFRLPFSIDSEKASAEYKDGVLHLTLPKQELSKPRQISVN